LRKEGNPKNNARKILERIYPDYEKQNNEVKVIIKAFQKKSIPISRDVLEGAFISPLEISKPEIQILVQTKQIFEEGQCDEDNGHFTTQRERGVKAVKHNKKTNIIDCRSLVVTRVCFNLIVRLLKLLFILNCKHTLINQKKLKSLSITLSKQGQIRGGLFQNISN
jgi:hypothetical protein